MTWAAWRERISSGVGWARARLTRRRVVLGTVALVGGSLLLIGVEALVRARLVSPEDRVPTGLYTRSVGWDGEEGQAALIGSVPGAPSEWREPVALDDIAPVLVDAVLAIEDKRFRDHPGIDITRIGGALLSNIRSGGIAEGGSTITQQLAKNLYLDARRTPLRKLREAALALVLEARYPKDQILEAYLNEIYLGQDNARAIHGVAAASRYYFGKSVGRLSLSEAATLAGMIHSPNRLAPSRHAAAARARRDVVLRSMAEQGLIDTDALDRALATRVVSRPHPLEVVDARYFEDAVRDRVPRRLPTRGAAVYTTLDAQVQRAADAAVRAGVARLGRGVEAALVAIDPRSGDVLALVGGADYGQTQFNRATDARRQPGSAFKPIVALAALEREGDEAPAYTLASTLVDEPLRVETATGAWQPANYDGSFRGAVTLRDALEQSLNVPFARIGLVLGPERIAATAHRMGIISPLAVVPSLALGSSEVSLLELVRAYGVLATEGDLAATRMVTGSRVGHGGLTAHDPVRRDRVADPAASYLVTSALEGAVREGTGAALNGGAFAGDIAGKTGTSNDWRDAWFIAYTPTLVVGVWVGHDDGASLHRTGAEAALPIVARFLSRLDLEGEEFPRPDGVVDQWVSGGETDWPAPCERRELFLEGTAPAGASCFRFDIDDQDIDIDLGDDWRDLLRQRAMDWIRERIDRELDRIQR
jgi:penicillin-binding protein 1B